QGIAQKTEIRGFVYDKITGEPILFTHVFFEGTTLGVATDIKGFYSLSKFNPGSYTLVCTYVGYDTIREKITINSGDIINRNIYLTQIAIELEEVIINSKKIESQTQVKISKIKITTDDIAKLPAIGATPDLAQYIQVLPGVVSSGDKGGQIYIRGGTPIQNKVILDGMTIYNPFHSLGLFSVFDIDMIRNIDVFAGGFDAEYGDRISAVMDVNSIEGNKTRLSGKIGSSTFSSKLILNGPLKKFKAEEGNSNFIFAIRNSYLDKTAPLLYGYADENGLPYSFNDVYGKVSFNDASGSGIKLFGFNFRDKVDYTGITSYEWGSAGIGTQFLLVPVGSSTIIEGHLSYSKYRIDQLELDNLPRYSLIGGFEGGMKFSYYLGNDLIRYGFEMSGFQTDFRYYNASGRRIGDPENTTNMAGFFKYKKTLGNFIMVPSLRMQYYASLQETSLEPRFGAKYNATDYLRFKLAIGKYTQDLISAFSDRDVVNLFYGFLTAPDDVPDHFDGKEINSRLQKAMHYILGAEIDIKEHSTLNLEGYIKDFYQLTNINRNKIFDDTPDFQDKPEYLRSDFIIEQGLAYGMNFHYVLDLKPVYIWFVYDFAFVERYDGIMTYTPHWDRRHNIQFLFNLAIGKKKPVDLSFRWNYGSPFPFTQTQGFYEYLDFSEGITQDYTSTNGNLGILYGDLNGGRLPPYHRLDISLTKKWKLNKHNIIEGILSVTNAYDRNNMFYFDRVSNERIDQLPILPSAGVSWSF
ncbi:MAG: carboxypeptidase-like regulatory domain-containing protein, partial [Bacteroidetes bacterium]|nr:carboxypeptidase-like regulatory domain-containing protein [Bacteroidota bacterium]